MTHLQEQLVRFVRLFVAGLMGTSLLDPSQPLTRHAAIAALVAAAEGAYRQVFPALTAAAPVAVAPSLPPWPVVKAELASAVADRITARKEAHAPARPARSHRGPIGLT